MTTQFRRLALSGAAALVLTGFAAASLAQTPAPGSAATTDQGSSYGSGMMNGYGPGYGAGMMGGPGGGFGQGMMGGAGPGYGPGMMNGFGPGHAWSGNGKATLADRFEALKQELKITSDEAPAWKAYTDAVTASDQSFFTAMKAAFSSNTKTAVTPDDRFALMSQMITLKKQNFDDQKTAAEALVAKLTPYQSGQAHEILPGLAQGGGFGCGYGMGPAMMNF
jgi:hypothetical protein